MILGNVAMDDALCASYATSVGIVVASVEYRLAPEFPDPTPIDDCSRGLAWLFGTAEALGIDPARINEVFWGVGSHSGIESGCSVR